jgi:CRISPR-associated protein Cas1
MTILYVQEQGAVVRRNVEQIRVTHRRPRQRQEQLLKSISVRELEQVVLSGNVQLTSQAAALLLENDVDIVFLSQYGKYRGRLSKDGAKYARLRHAQLALSGNERRSLETARAIVRTKLANQRNLLRRVATMLPTSSAQLEGAAEQIETMRTTCTRATDLDTLRGYEGRGGASYFGAFRHLLDPRWGFQGRAYYPPPDPFNALLSFGYSLLLKDMTATLQIVGLDPYLGCFHALEYGRPSLALDLMEEFRPILVDEVALGLALSGALRPDEFSFTGQSERPVMLGDAKQPIVIGAYEQRKDTAVPHPASHSHQTLRNCVELQARIYARLVLGDRSTYEGLIV